MCHNRLDYVRNKLRAAGGALAAALAACDAAALIATGVCAATTCCPKLCGVPNPLDRGSGCCDAGESCVDQGDPNSRRGCRPSDQQVCSGKCCAKGETCCGGTCCPAGNHCCGSSCCSSGIPCCGDSCCSLLPPGGTPPTPPPYITLRGPRRAASQIVAESYELAVCPARSA